MKHYIGYGAAMVAGLLVSMGLCGILPDSPASMSIPIGIVMGVLGAAMTSAYKRGLSDGQLVDDGSAFDSNT